MKKQLLFLGVLHFISFICGAQCAQNTNKVLLIGDSWAAFCWQFNSHNVNFDKYGLPDKKAYSTGASISPTGTADLSQSGAEARNYLTPAKKTIIQNAFIANPDIEIVHLSLGGNDFLGDWDTTWTQSQINAETVVVLDSITSIINFLRSQKSTVKVFLSTYDYANFAEAINGSTTHPFYSRWAAMLKPRFSQINSVLASVNTAFKNYALAGTDLYFVDNLGLMQYIYGQTTPLLYAPGGTYPPMSVPFPGGNPNYPTPLVAMNTYFTIKDAFHLSEQGFNYFVENQVKEFYFNALRNYDITVLNEHAKSGYVNAATQFSDTSMIIGNISSVKHAGLLSFTMPVLDPTKSIYTASIFIKRKSNTGTNPIGTYSISVDMKTGTLGNTAFPDNSDFTATADITTGVCQFGSVSGNNYWLRMDLPQSICQQLVSNQTYQFRLSFPGNSAIANQTLEFYNDASGSNAPFLDLQYANPLSVKSASTKTNNTMVVYPNPSLNGNCSLRFSKPFLGKIEVYDLSGKKISETTVNETALTTELKAEHLNTGLYFIIAKDSKSETVYKEKLLIKK